MSEANLCSTVILAGGGLKWFHAPIRNSAIRQLSDEDRVRSRGCSEPTGGRFDQGGKQDLNLVVYQIAVKIRKRTVLVYAAYSRYNVWMRTNWRYGLSIFGALSGAVISLRETVRMQMVCQIAGLPPGCANAFGVERYLVTALGSALLCGLFVYFSMGMSYQAAHHVRRLRNKHKAK